MFKIIITKNGEEKRAIHISKKEFTAFSKFDQLVSINESIICPERNAYDADTHKFTEVKYELVLLKEKGPEDVNRVVRDKLGRPIDINIIDKWIPLKFANYHIEEEFKIFGKEDKLNTRQIFNEYLKDSTEHIQISSLQNKLYIESDSKFCLIFCKTIDDSNRLHDALKNQCIKFGVKNILYFGQASKIERKKMYQKIHKLTKITMGYLYKNTTR